MLKISTRLGQYRGYWCHGSLCHHVNSYKGADYVILWHNQLIVFQKEEFQLDVPCKYH